MFLAQDFEDFLQQTWVKNCLFGMIKPLFGTFIMVFSKILCLLYIDIQRDKRNMKIFPKNCLSVMKKVVLLHPLSEGERVLDKRGDGSKFFESLRPAQDRRRGDAPSVEGTF